MFSIINLEYNLLIHPNNQIIRNVMYLELWFGGKEI